MRLYPHTTGRSLLCLLILVIVVCAPVGVSAGVVMAGYAPASHPDPTGSDGGVVRTSSFQGGITDIIYTGEGTAVVENGRTYVWMGEPTRMYVTVQPFNLDQRHRVCLNATSDRENATQGGGNTTGNGTNTTRTREVVRQYGCKAPEMGASKTQVIFDLPSLRINTTGSYRLVVTLTNGTRTANASIPIFVLNRSGDLDGDGLVNNAEVQRGTNLNGTDTDGDGLQDGPEVHEYGTDPANPDTDGDGVQDGYEIQVGSDPTKPDTDEDGLTDYEELNEYGTDPTKPDTDDDGFDDPKEIEAGTGPTDPNSHPPTGPIDWLASLITAAVSNPWTWAVLVVLLVVVAYEQRKEWSVFGADRIPDTTTENTSQASHEDADDATAAGDEELLPPDERVHRQLDASGGRLKQSEFVELTGWSKAKVSRVLSQMEENGEIQRERIGRENVVSRPEENVEGESSEPED